MAFVRLTRIIRGMAAGYHLLLLPGDFARARVAGTKRFLSCFV